MRKLAPNAAATLLATIVAVGPTDGCGYRLVRRAHLPGGCRTVHVAVPDVSRGGDPAFGSVLRRSLIFELRRRGLSVRGAGDAELTLDVTLLSISSDQVFLVGRRPAADEIDVAVEAVAWSAASTRSVWRSGRLLLRAARPWGANIPEAEHRWRAALRDLAARVAARIVGSLTNAIRSDLSNSSRDGGRSRSRPEPRG